MKNHFPLAVAEPAIMIKKLFGKIRRQLVAVPYGPVRRKINGRVNFEFVCTPFLDKGDFLAMYTGSYDLILCDFLRRNLAVGDVFLDVGANVGYISAVAASRVGPSGAVHGFEPLPECFERLRVLAQLNPEHNFVFKNVALGDRDGVLPIHYNPVGDSRNATLVPKEKAEATVEVPVVRLDQYIEANIERPERVSVIKIDVEGFEFPVLRGLESFFRHYRPPIVCEIKPWELTKLGYNMNEFEEYMGRFSYAAFDSAFRDRRVSLTQLSDLSVVVFRAV